MSVAEVATPSPAAAPAVRRRWWILATIIVCEFVAELDTSIVNVAIPSLGRALHANATELQWVVDAYVIVFASLLLFCGSVVDRIGGRRVLFAGSAVFAVASTCAALAITPAELISARAVMGIGAALIFPATVFILADVFPPYERMRAFSVWSAFAGLSFAIGPTVGGFVIEHGGWSAIFWLNLPILAGSSLAAAFLVPRTLGSRSRRLDRLGAVLAVTGLTALFYAVIEAPELGWAHSTVVASLAAAAVLLVGFIVWERRARMPLLRLDKLRGTRALRATTVLVLTFLPFGGALFILTQYLQYVLGYSPLEAGVRMLPVAVTYAVGASFAIGLAMRIGTKLTVMIGFGLVALALAIMARVTTHSGYGLVAVTLGVGGFGMGLTVSPTMALTLAGIPLSDAGVGSSLNMTGLTLGGALGVAILGSIMTTTLSSDIATASEFFGLTHKAKSLLAILQVAWHYYGEHNHELLASARREFVKGATPAFRAGAGIAGGGAVLAALLLPGKSPAWVPHAVPMEPAHAAAAEPTTPNAT